MARAPIRFRKPIDLNRALVLSALLLVMLLPQRSVNAQTYGGPWSHNVTVSVQTITLLRVNGGAVNLSISGGGVVAGQDQMTVVDQLTGLSWALNSSNKKITVATNLGAPTYSLKLLALSPSQGTAASEVTLSTTAMDLVNGIGRTANGSCTLRYTGVALASQGTGSDNHTITFTLVVP